MLKRRIIPKLLLRRSRHSARTVLVTTVRFGESLEVGDPVSQAKIYQAQAADELVFLDLDATGEGRGPNVGVLRRAAEQVFMPITFGGGVRTLDDFRQLLASGADKVAVNTAAVARPDLLREAAEAFGNQCVVLSIDFRRAADGTCRVWTQGAREATRLDPVTWARQAEALGAGEILLTAIERDGTRAGLDLEATRAIAEAVSIPVIASGGCGVAAHFTEGLRDGRADAVASGTFFTFRDQNPMQARSHVRNAGLPIRLHT